MFRRQDGLIVTQADHSRLAGELIMWLGEALHVPSALASKVAGAVALHDWPHFGYTASPNEKDSPETSRRTCRFKESAGEKALPVTSHADVIEIGKKTAEQQRELMERLTGHLPLEPFTELVVRLHWQRLTEDTGEGFPVETNLRRIDQLLTTTGLSRNDAQRLDGWTDLGDIWAFYLSRNEPAEGRYELLEFQGDRVWQLSWRTTPQALVVQGVDRSIEAAMSLIGYEEEGYPGQLSPAICLIFSKFVV